MTWPTISLSTWQSDRVDSIQGLVTMYKKKRNILYIFLWRWWLCEWAQFYVCEWKMQVASWSGDFFSSPFSLLVEAVSIQRLSQWLFFFSSVVLFHRHSSLGILWQLNKNSKHTHILMTHEHAETRKNEKAFFWSELVGIFSNLGESFRNFFKEIKFIFVKENGKFH